MILIISVTGFIIFTNLRTNLRANAEERIFALTESKALEVEEQIKNIELLSENLRSLVITTIDYDKVRKDEIQPTFTSIIKNFNNPSGWVVFDSKHFEGGHVLSISQNSDGQYIRNADYDARKDGYIDDPWYAKAVELGSWWTAPYYWEPWDEDIITFSTTLELGGDIIATVGGEFYFDDLKKKIKSVTIFKSGYMTLMDQNFNILYHPNEAIDNLKTFNDGEFNAVATAIEQNTEKTDIIEYQLAGEDKVMVYYRLSNGWIISAHPVIDEMFAQLDSTRNSILIISLVSIIIAIIISLFIGKSLSKPIITIKEKVTEAAHGNLTEFVESKSQDEIGQMSHELNAFITKLNRILSEIKSVINLAENQNIAIQNVVDNIIKGQDSQNFESLDMKTEVGILELSASMDEVLDSVQNQVAGAEETLAGLEEISVSTDEVSKHSDQTLEMSIQTTKVAESSNDSIRVMNEEISKINDSVEITNSRIDKLIQLSSDIGGIVTAINDLSEQTNLLALNAAIEAARAGEAGKGFAVVADEVRKLAEQTNEETFKIEQIIKNIQTEVKDVKDANLEVMDNVKKGTEVSHKVSDEIDKIIDIARVNEEAIRSITTSSKEQAIAINEITKAVAEISQDANVIEGTSVTNVEAMKKVVELLNEKYDSINELNDSFKKLQNEINFFKL